MMENNNTETVNKTFLKSNGIINDDNSLTEQGISLAACMEADNIFLVLNEFYPGCMDLMYDMIAGLIERNQCEAAVSLLEVCLEHTGEEKSVHLQYLKTAPEQTQYYLEELLADWDDLLIQTMEDES